MIDNYGDIVLVSAICFFTVQRQGSAIVSQQIYISAQTTIISPKDEVFGIDCKFAIGYNCFFGGQMNARSTIFHFYFGTHLKSFFIIGVSESKFCFDTMR